MITLLIKNAVLIDPDTGKERIGAAGLEDGRVRLFADGQSVQAQTSIDADGAYLLPGLIDFHTHLFTTGSSFGVNADLLLSSGATMAVDMGTAGSLGYEAFRRSDLLPRTMKIKSFLNISPLGQPGSGISEPLARTAIQEEAIEKLVKAYPDEIRGLKVRLSRSIVGQEGIGPLLHAVELGERLGLPVCVHTTDPPVTAAEIAKVLRPGDIYSHMYHNKGMTILGEDGTVYPELLEAQQRGVYLEVGNGRMNFNFEVAETAIEQGVFPDIISSDATAGTYANAPDMKDLAFVMSKFWNMGMPLHRIIASVTKHPAGCLGLAGQAGVLTDGCIADLTILRPYSGPVVFTDSDGNERKGTRSLAPEMTMINGKIVYLQGKLGLRKENL